MTTPSTKSKNDHSHANFFEKLKTNIVSFCQASWATTKKLPSQAYHACKAAAETIYNTASTLYDYPLHFLFVCAFYLKPYADSTSSFFKNAWDKLKTKMGFEDKNKPSESKQPQGEPPVIIPPCCDPSSPTRSHDLTHLSPLVVNAAGEIAPTISIQGVDGSITSPKPYVSAGRTPSAPEASCYVKDCKMAYRA